ncbi:uncharacterized protein SETTUDRAFT_39060 [Exserohilum turcica Et28A]|uniref:Uncharacterized protein n=1 Tax=Exserohilum turcicum (strain 28A) TaxID=671987 RepID=R0K4B0_EXST2|nr:uncharacterized protein SETTUDRAFT_39060 [Exserohilum turcica Et28A]EOA87933.1 hypothetical protein SETTUDRAFT_39060 [Exserohilum turcica Et28A]
MGGRRAKTPLLGALVTRRWWLVARRRASGVEMDVRDSDSGRVAEQSRPELDGRAVYAKACKRMGKGGVSRSTKAPAPHSEARPERCPLCPSVSSRHLGEIGNRVPCPRP